MKNLILISLALFIFLGNGVAQFSADNSIKNNERKQIPSFDGFHKNITFEFGGTSILTGVKYDMRLNRGRMDGIGFSAGLGGLFLSRDDQNINGRVSILTIPLEFNHIIGKRRHGFVTGLGILPVYGEVDVTDSTTSPSENVETRGFGIAGPFATIGWRFSPLKTGFTFQIAYHPIYSANELGGTISLNIGIGFK